MTNLIFFASKESTFCIFIFATLVLKCEAKTSPHILPPWLMLFCCSSLKREHKLTRFV